MKFRCPYCKGIIEGELHSSCPHCGKAMMIPDHLLQKPARERKKVKEAIAREYERKLSALGTYDFSFGRKPSGIIFAMAILAFCGILIFSRLKTAPGQAVDSRVMRAERELSVLYSAIELFHSDCGVYPDEKAGLQALVLNPGNPKWVKPYIRPARIPHDPWRRPYVYRLKDGVPSLFSSGPDGLENTADDIHPPITEAPEELNSRNE